MSRRYQGGFVTATEVTTSSTVASGVFSIEQQIVKKKGGEWVQPLNRCLVAGGNDGTGATNVIEFFDPTSDGNATDFGDLIAAASSMGGASSSTRGLFFGGNHGNKTIDFVTLASTGDAQDFGDITNDFGNTDPAAMASNGTIAVFAGGQSQALGNDTSRICKVTIASQGNTTDFTGDAGSVTITQHDTVINSGSGTQGMINNTTRFIITGNSDGTSENSRMNTITLVNFDANSQSSDFGNATISATERMGHSSSTRGVMAGGNTSGGNSNVIDFITLASTGDATDFGDLTAARKLGAGTGNKEIACFAGGGFSNVNIIDKVTIASAGNATDFGDLARTVTRVSSCCNLHGGIA
tara:strand:+ start:920 stop:1981 length:1062 start_codon:yes stop_codon:yes gene_type:complete